MDWPLLVSSGPVWGAVGVITAALFGWITNRQKTATDGTSAALAAVNAGHKQLVDGLFQQVKLLTEELEALRARSVDAERRYREASDRILSMEREIAELKGRAASGGD